MTPCISPASVLTLADSYTRKLEDAYSIPPGTYIQKMVLASAGPVIQVFGAEISYLVHPGDVFAPGYYWLHQPCTSTPCLCLEISALENNARVIVFGDPHGSERCALQHFTGKNLLLND